MKGKAYAHKSGNRQGDFYSTPKSLVWVAKDIIKNEFFLADSILEPAAGKGAISEELNKFLPLSRIRESDLYNYTFINYLDHFFMDKFVITNPPFSLWDEFVLKAKTHCTKFMFIGRLNYLGTNGRLQKGIWNNLKAIYPFNRYVDYQTPYREDGLFHVGAMATAWFLWDMNYKDKPIMEILDVQKYAKLGGFNK